ncbi:type IV secretion system lipoprotein VirB7 [Sinorhizobium meliloti]|uniref:type IV secretion system lipoprotein VirB7 n=1 Tax=Rhizobium meliloti TaxID=382 RepID=UPI000FD997F4|nr:type IV secretion system lipoprotein VirB7 [Sinorhizobium meliloti]MDW9489921.1 type IV secretion system lipoprotein VirB7 [Sinorhizobium meliloti]MDW9608735.1 type IV secretion system lipoprotein VirB7 [Sinorhizobium meliloti]MDW9676568.1 type IV secretion system lipoprotein VirB7 [Sinorhizobium meliloti]MDW9724815.1 type IV secretion system lipoprotein VirB7 [Sinorhizobium meliloti]MDW9730816.1 type IV secretion system lipoprotein VirB7 [Sinorhizobium meliloti]
MKYCSLILFLALAACKTSDTLATCKGPAFQLNVERWQPTASDLQFECTGGPNEER